MCCAFKRKNNLIYYATNRQFVKRCSDSSFFWFTHLTKVPDWKCTFGAKWRNTLTFLLRIILMPESLALKTLIFLFNSLLFISQSWTGWWWSTVVNEWGDLARPSCPPLALSLSFFTRYEKKGSSNNSRGVYRSATYTWSC